MNKRGRSPITELDRGRLGKLHNIHSIPILGSRSIVSPPHDWHHSLPVVVQKDADVRVYRGCNLEMGTTRLFASTGFNSQSREPVLRVHNHQKCEGLGEVL